MNLPTDFRTWDAMARLLCRYREDAEWTQAKVAALTRFNIKVISTWETGRRTHTLNLADLLVLLRVYDKTLAEFERDLWAMRHEDDMLVAV